MIIESANQVKHFSIVIISRRQFAVDMHISGKIMIPLGIAMIIFGGVMMYGGTSRGVSNFDEFTIYEGNGTADVELSGFSEGGYLIVAMEGEYADGTSMTTEDNMTELTEEDCELVSNFTLKDSEDSERVYFEPTCENSDDTTEDGVIHIGYICKDGCPDGTYTFYTNNTDVQIYDVDALISGIGLLALAWIGGPSCCGCCGFIAFIGLILGFTLKTPEQKMALAQGHQTPGVMPQQEGTMHSVGNPPGNI